MNKPFTTVLTILLAALLLPGCEEESAPPPEPSVTVGDRIAVDRATIYKDSDGSPLGSHADLIVREIPVAGEDTIETLRKSAASQGKVLVIDCWATWCGSCVVMFPHLHKAMKERGDGVMLVSLTFDEGEELTKKAGEFLTKQDAWEGALQAAEGSDAKDAIAAVLSDTWDGGVLPAVFVYNPDGTTAYELLETRGEVQDWVDGIAAAVDAALPDAGE